MSSTPRILVATPDAAESSMIADWLVSERFEPVQTRTIAGISTEIRDRPFDLLVADAALALGSGSPVIGLVRARNRRTPVVVIGEPDATREAQALARGVTFVARPVERAWFTCTVSMALLESRPERRSPRKSANRVEAIVDGVPSHIVDVSKEGLRLEVPRHKSAPLPVFPVRVPMLGITLCVRRMWSSKSPRQDRDAAWYGAELSQNPPKVERAWLEFVDAIPTGRAAIESA